MSSAEIICFATNFTSEVLVVLNVWSVYKYFLFRFSVMNCIALLNSVVLSFRVAIGQCDLRGGSIGTEDEERNRSCKEYLILL
jgi:hypothetical protein